MKLSIAWIFDHIDAAWDADTVERLIPLFNQKVAEIEGSYKVDIRNLADFSIGTIEHLDADALTVRSSEWLQSYSMPMRKGALVGQHFLIKKDGSWVTAHDIAQGTDALMPALQVTQADRDGAWKKTFEHLDYILEIDNKSITHRPDMWGHRGFAREIAALLDLPFKSEHEFLQSKKIVHHDSIVSATASNPFSLKIEAPIACKRLAGMYIGGIVNQSSSLTLAHRLARVDARAIDAIVDITNYVMLDWGQPMHAFDARSFDQKELVARMAKNKEKLMLLDGQEVELTQEDLVISGGAQPVALVGVMGGASSCVTADTSAIIIEAAGLDAVTIRKTAARYKKRTEASARFEKSLDPNQNVIALMRFIKIMRDQQLTAHEADEILSAGMIIEPTQIIMTHELIEKRLGVTIAPEFVIKKLTQLCFQVIDTHGTYIISVPTFRGTKDIKIKEDIIEEIGRYYGYATLEPQFPRLQLKPSTDLAWVYRQRAIKHTLAYACNMQELYTYAFFDEEFLASIKWQPGPTLEVERPVSENWRRLVTTLVPNLLKSVAQASADHDVLRFFELARTWHTGEQLVERKSLTGIIFDTKKVDFYAGKAELHTLFEVLKLSVEWKKVERPESPWYAPYQTAHIMHNDTRIGTAGKVHPTFLQPICQGDAFIFELDADFLLSYTHPIIQFAALSKFPEMIRDISILVSNEISADQVSQVIAQVDPKIVHVKLLDFFEKNEWPDKRAMTFRFVIADHERTMTKVEADSVWDAVAAHLKQLGATTR